jgi:hypothetical protein
MSVGELTCHSNNLLKTVATDRSPQVPPRGGLLPLGAVGATARAALPAPPTDRPHPVALRRDRDAPASRQNRRCVASDGRGARDAVQAQDRRAGDEFFRFGRKVFGLHFYPSQKESERLYLISCPHPNPKDTNKFISDKPALESQTRKLKYDHS